MTLVFLCGAVFGALAHNVAAQRAVQRSAFWTDMGKSIYLERVKKELNLSPSQTEQMETILDDFAKYYRTVLSEGKTRMMQILDDGQRRKFNQLLQDSR